tara:strand:- start:461 stop:985 length:525 start_codon:yes stop_codon:yes gene_type:complete
MKYLVKFFVVTSLLLVCTYASAEQKIVYLDMKFILNNSKAGKGAQQFLQKTFKENQKKFVEEENKLKKEEGDLIAKSNILSKDEYKKKSDMLRKKVAEYQAERRKSLEKITKMRTDSRKQLIEKLQPIINTYIKDNNVSLLVDKKNILGGNTDLDITNIIIEKLDKELPSLNLK